MAEQRVSQEAIEVLEAPSTTNARVSQLAVEVLDAPTASSARVSQIAIEVLQASPQLGNVDTSLTWV